VRGGADAHQRPRGARWPTSSTTWPHREFADKGLAGARIDAIAEATRTSKRMIYYYFGSKDGLYVRCWKRPTGACAASRAELHLDDLPPEDALRRLVGFTVDYQLAHPEFIRLVMTENIHRGQYLAQQRGIQNSTCRPSTGCAGCLRARRGTGVFRAGIDPVDLHMSISALSGVQRGQPAHLLADLPARPGRPARSGRAARQHRRDGGALRAEVAGGGPTGPAGHTGGKLSSQRHCRVKAARTSAQ
jgi:AcrR family transcriptional regulator